MRNFEDANKFKKEGIKPHQILITITNDSDYEVERKLLLQDIEGLKCDEYLVLEGNHCSCYDFDDTLWTGTVYVRNELYKLANAEFNKNNIFWKEVLRLLFNIDYLKKDKKEINDLF